MTPSPELREFLEQYIYLVDANNYELLYDLAWQKGQCIFELTHVLLSAEINPVVHMTCIPDGYLNGDYDITSFNIPNSITVVKDGAFEDCQNLSKVKFSNNIIDFGQFSFAYTKLDNPALPDATITLGDYMFYSCEHLTRITIPPRVKFIPSGFASLCIKLTTVCLPRSITHICLYAFRNCDNLKTIHYQGTLDEWNKIHIDPNAFDFSGTTTVYCSDGNNLTI